MSFPRTLPSLQGKRGSVAHIVYRVLALIVFVLTTGSTVFGGIHWFRNVPAAARYGLWFDSDDAGRPIVFRAGATAMAAGVKPFEHIVAIDNVELGSAATLYGAGARVSRVRGPLILTLADDAGRRTRHIVLRSKVAISSDGLFHGLPALAYGAVRMGDQLLLATVLITMSLLLARRRPRDPEAMLLAFGFLLIAYQWDANEDWLIQFGINYDPAIRDWLDDSLYTFGFWCLLVGLCAFPDGDFATRWSRFARLLPTTYMIANMASDYKLWQFALPTEALDVPIFTAVAGSLLFRYRKTPAGTQRQQIKWAAFGAAIMMLASLFTLALQTPALAAWLGPPLTYLLDVFGNEMKSLAFPLGLLLSLLRYRLYDADAVIVRSAGYAALTAALLAIFTCTEQLAQALGQDYFGDSLGAFAGGLGAAAATVMIAPLHRRAGDWAERRFRKSLIGLRDGLPIVVGDMREIATFTAIAETVLERCEAALHDTGSALLIRGAPVAVRHVSTAEVEVWSNGWQVKEAARISVDRHDPLFPVRVPLQADGVGLIGWLLLGRRPDGSLYGKDESETLAAIADPVARALAIAIERDRRETSLRQELDAYRQLIDRLIQHTGLSESGLPQDGRLPGTTV
jgi:hypothetical protein